jgi:hypothetical protein
MHLFQAIIRQILSDLAVTPRSISYQPSLCVRSPGPGTVLRTTPRGYQLLFSLWYFLVYK